MSCSQFTQEPPTVHNAANVFQSMCYSNKNALSAGIIVAGWDGINGPGVYNIPLGGGLFRQPWAIGGSGSTYVYGYCDATFKEGWGQDETIEFVKNSECNSPYANTRRADAEESLQLWHWPCREMARPEESFAWLLLRKTVLRGCSSRATSCRNSGKGRRYSVRHLSSPDGRIRRWL